MVEETGSGPWLPLGHRRLGHQTEQEVFGVRTNTTSGDGRH